MLEPLRRAHQEARISAEDGQEILSRVIEGLPEEIRQHIERAQAEYGLWCTSSTTGGLWVEDIVGEVGRVVSPGAGRERLPGTRADG